MVAFPSSLLCFAVALIRTRTEGVGTEDGQKGHLRNREPGYRMVEQPTKD